MKVITGNQSPKAEEKTYYEVTDTLFGFNPSLFFNEEGKYTWTLFKKYKSEYKPVANNKKHGIKVPYTFGEKVVGIPFKIVIHQETKNLFNQSESKLVASYVVTPKTSKESIIGRVILLNRGKSNVNKAKFNETLTAQARTTNLLGKEITFYLWEEGASEGDKYKKPKKGRVNKDGIAEVQFNLIDYASPKTVMSFFTISKIEKNFFVTAVYEKKKTTNKGAVQASAETKPKVKPDKPITPADKPVSEPIGRKDNNPLQKQTDIKAEGLNDSSNQQEVTRSPSNIEPPANNKDKNGNCKSCQVSLTVNDLGKFMSATVHGSIINKAPFNTRIPAYINYLNQYMTAFEINKNCYRRANFLGQVAKETKFWSYKEDFIYDKTALLDLKNFQSVEGRLRAKEWGYGKNKSEVTKEIEIKIGNWAYGRSPKRSSLGNNECPIDKLNDAEQDGYKYRGRGLIQLTGRYNYTKFQEWYDINFAKLGLSPANFVKYPDLVFEPQYIVLSAIYFWSANNLNGKADAGIEQKHVLSISNVINGNESDAKKAIRYDYVKSAYSMLQEKATDCLLLGKKETKTTSEWHDPVDQPQITVHDFSGTYRPDFSSFGGHRGRPHTGLDIFAINKKTKIYACLNGEIVYSDSIPGYGKTIVLKVDKKSLEKYKKKYTLKYDKEEKEGGLYDSGDDRYILYGHLESYDFKEKEVNAGDVIATSGVTGVAEGTHGPHIHIEFTSKKLPQKGDGYKYRCNPLFYISLYSEDLKLQQKHNKPNKSTDKI